MASQPTSVTAIFDQLDELSEQQEQVSVGDVVASFGRRSYGPFLLVPALIDISPASGIPGLPTLMATIVAIFSVQMLIGRSHLWLPEFIRRRSISGRNLARALSVMHGTAHFLDRIFHRRMPHFTSGITPRLAAGIIIILAMTVPPLELIPFSNTIPMAAIAAFGLALLVRDGLLMLIAMIMSAAALGIIGFLIATQL